MTGQRRDRFGELLESEVLEEDAHECRGGWLEYATADQPRPCPRCRPHLVDGRPHPPHRSRLGAEK